MPKALVLGNGNIFIGLDCFGQIKDFYFPYVGLENQIGTFGANKIGIFVNNRLSWLSDPGWEIKIDYQRETLASDIVAIHQELQIEVRCLDVVYNERDIFIKKMTIKNLADHTREIRVFFNQQFQFYENNRAITAYYDPYLKDLAAIIHYRGRRVVAVSGDLEGKSFTDYTTGLMGIEGKLGTYIDAEDGVLAKNPIEHGAVDSTIGFSLMLEAGQKKIFYYWITVAKTIQEAKMLHDYILEKSPEHLIETTQNFWKAWVNKIDFNFYRLPESAVSLFKKSLLIMRVHIDNNGGIIASGDGDTLQYGRDTYSYVWPRDSAFVTMALDKAGYSDITRKFFEFANEVIDPSGYLLHKYRPDKSLGSSWHPWLRNGEPTIPIQEDETAIVLHALWEHYLVSKDLEFIEKIYNSLIKRAADFLLTFRDEKTKLPRPTYDIWEQQFSVSTYTATTVVAALEAAGRFAKLLGKITDQKKYQTGAKAVREAILLYLYDKQEQLFYKSINLHGDVLQTDKTIDASSFYGVFKFGVLEGKDERLVMVVKKTKELLSCNTKICGVGIGRFVGDGYYRINPSAPSNPWVITALWLAQYYINQAASEADLELARDLLLWVVARATPAGILPEQINPYTGEPLSVAPLVWSHAEFVTTVIQYLEKLEQLEICKMVNPMV